MVQSKFIVNFFDTEGIKPDPFLPERDKRRKPVILNLRDLYPGNRFIIPALEEYYRNLYLRRMSDCSASIGGENRYSLEEPFKKLSPGYSIALTTRVIRV